MIEKIKNTVNNVIDQLIVMGEGCQTPRYLNNYLRTIPELPGFPTSNLVIDRWEKEVSKSESVSKAAQLEEELAISCNPIGDKVLATK